MFRKKSFYVVGVAILAFAIGGIAAALWSANGTGSGRASSGSAQSVTVTASTGPSDLYPGFTQGDVYFTLTNPNPYAITFTTMTAGTAISANPTLCPNVNVSVVGATGLSLTVAANSTSAQLSVADVASMALAAPDGCQNLTFDVPLTLTGSQV